VTRRVALSGALILLGARFRSPPAPARRTASPRLSSLELVTLDPSMTTGTKT